MVWENVLNNRDNTCTLNEKMTAPVTYTQNGDITNATTGTALLDIWSGITRNQHYRGLEPELEERLLKLVKQAWQDDAIMLIRLLFFKRDCRGGAGERAIFLAGFQWLINNHEPVAMQLLHLIPEYGSWRDLKQLDVDVDHLAELFQTQLDKDSTGKSISLCAKWAPTPKTNKALSNAIARKLYKGGEFQKRYRQLISRLREQLDVCERKQSLGKWDQIEYQKVPSLAMNRYRKVFARRDTERWNEYLGQLANREAKVNSTQLMPHEILRQPLGEQLTISQWDTMVEDVRKRGTLGRAVAMADVSGSMSGLPMDVAVALGILVSQCSSIKDALISFTDRPQFFYLRDKTLAEKVCEVQLHVGYNTNLRLAFEELLKKSRELGLTPEEAPQTLLIISDMEFDDGSVSRGWNGSTYEDIKKMYNQYEYQAPTMVFWNVNGRLGTMPVTQLDRGVITLSGWSQNLLELVMNGDVSDPLAFMKSVLNRPRYSAVTDGLVF